MSLFKTQQKHLQSIQNICKNYNCSCLQKAKYGKQFTSPYSRRRLYGIVVGRILWWSPSDPTLEYGWNLGWDGFYFHNLVVRWHSWPSEREVILSGPDLIRCLLKRTQLFLKEVWSMRYICYWLWRWRGSHGKEWRKLRGSWVTLTDSQQGNKLKSWNCKEVNSANNVKEVGRGL